MPLRAITTAAQDAAQIVRRLREFHRPDDGAETRVSINLNQLVEQAVTLTRPKWKDEARARGVEVEVKCELGDLRPVSGDPAELREMFTNLIFNAVDAMPQGGCITIHTQLEDGEVQMSLTDTGTGMDEQTRRRCLEPFFTTKGERGTGLGLSAVYGIIQRHGGILDIESELGKGTCFCIRLPASAAEQADDDTGGEGATVDSSGIRRILVVDDQPIILELLQQQLQEDGHEVETANDGCEALEKLGTDRFDLLLTDQSMPNMTGEELALAAREKYPQLAVILLTGFGGEDLDTEHEMPGVDIILGKPATQVDLRRAIVQAMHKPSEAAVAG